MKTGLSAASFQILIFETAMTKTMVRPALIIGLSAFVMTFHHPGLDFSSGARAQEASKEEVPLTSQMVRMGQKLLMKSLGASIQAPNRGLVSLNVEKFTLVDLSGGQDQAELQRLRDQLARNDDRIKNETNPLLREQLQAVKLGLEYSKRQVDLLEQQAQRFRFDSDSVLRKSKYEFPDDKLIVVVADFSSGNPEEGREIADEIAQNLDDISKATAIPLHVLVGEIKPGLHIRSEHLARDIGKSFPADTEYVVIWGTLSPRTVGKYRPHLTCCWKRDENSGNSVGVDLAMEASDLPLEGEPPARTREAYRRLIGVACAAVPNVYAAHCINRDRTPDLEQYLSYLGKDTEEAQGLRRELEPLTRWTKARAEWSRARQGKRLRRTSEISGVKPYPMSIYNEKDGSVLALITDGSGNPRQFGKNGMPKAICYMDTLEVSNQQYIEFLNSGDEKGGQEMNKVVGGVPWIDIGANWTDIRLSDEGEFSMKRSNYIKNPVVNVSWFGARDYCSWAGEELPTVEEWEAAAAHEDRGAYPWGRQPTKPTGFWSSTSPGGTVPTDRSIINCFDMMGNVSEWCADRISDDAEYEVRGGCFKDSDPKLFEVGRRMRMAQIAHDGRVGFRGVIHLPVE